MNSKPETRESIAKPFAGPDAGQWHVLWLHGIAVHHGLRLRRLVTSFGFRISDFAIKNIILSFLAATILIASGAEPKSPTTLPDWNLELVASAPGIKHPSVVCSAPDGRVFVAEDPMDITAPADAKLGRILCLHPDGRWTVFATNLHAVFGMQYLEGKLYVLHNPKFSVFTDLNGVGQDRVDLIEQTNPNPWALDWNDHIPANFRLGMDGYFYVAIGDKGLYQCQGRDGSVVNLHGGGILRLRPDGTGLEIFCTGVRNILDVAMNTEDDFFTYDNTDEHQWMGRLTHMVDGGFYGYPHDFIPRRPYTLWMMHDFGAGAACGTLAHNEDALPAGYHGNLFLSDFGKRQVTRVRVARDGGTYNVVAHEDLFRDSPADFRPVGIGWSADGAAMYICDWQHRDVKENDANVGRLWKLSWTGTNHSAPKPSWYLPLALGQSTNVPATALIAALSHPSHAVRMTAQRALVRSSLGGMRSEIVEAMKRLVVEPGFASTLQPFRASTNSFARRHALWALDAIDGGLSARKEILAAASDADASVARQAIRQLGQRQVNEAAPTLARQIRHPDASIRFHAASALGRIAATNAIPALLLALADTDLFARYATFTALNRIGRAHPQAWPAIVSGLESSDPRIREATTFALRETFDESLVAALRSGAPMQEPVLRSLAALHHQPPPWKGEWWAYHPAKAPAPERNVPWAGTAAILEILRAALTNQNPAIRLVAIGGLGEARDTNSASQLLDIFTHDVDSAIRRAALNALGRSKAEGTAAAVTVVLRDPRTDAGLLDDAVRLAPQFGGGEITGALVELLLRNPANPTRLAVIDALGKIGGEPAQAALRSALNAAGAEERRAAIRALGNLRDTAAVPGLLIAWKATDTHADALAALCRVADLRAIDAYLDGLASADPAVREQCRKALTPLRQEALPLIESRSFSGLVLAELRRVFAADADVLKRQIFANGAKPLEPADYERHAAANAGDARQGEKVFFNEQGVACIRCHIIAGQGGVVGPDLTLAGAQFSRAQLIESVLHPSKAVREGYQQIVIETKDNEDVSGALKADTADGLTLVDGAGRTNFVPRASIVNRRTSELSLMPEGLHVGLTLDEFADLIAYLESRKNDPRREVK